MTLLPLSRKERDILEKFTIRTKDAKQLRRAQAVLWTVDGEPVQEIATRLRVTPQYVYKWISRFKERNDRPIPERFVDTFRSGRPTTAKGIIDPLIEKVFEKDPGAFGYNSTIWTKELLRQYLKNFHQIDVSGRSIALAMARLELRWKRPRHTLTLRPKNWRQIKGGSNEGCVVVNGVSH